MTILNKEYLNELIEEAKNRINNGVSKTLTARKTSEKPPQDTRHLTDTRTRVSTLLEYSLSYELNNILNERKLNHSISNVLWNVFPDLVVRDGSFNNTFGLEIKALHSAAEEKSANLHTPLSLIRKGQDFLVILIWGWVREKNDICDITYPHIHDFGIFDAWLVARMRDVTWLINDGERIKGIDISTPIINSTDGKYKAEEGNLGKLMRIDLSDKASPELPYYKQMYDESIEYEKFKKSIIYLGLVETSRDINDAINGEFYFDEDIKEPPQQVAIYARSTLHNITVYFAAGDKKKNTNWKDVITDLHASNSNVIIHFGSKLSWNIFKHDKDKGWITTLNGKKPDIELESICTEILK